MSKSNNWGVSFSTIKFFETALNGHDRVIEVQRSDDILFGITLVNNSVVNALLLNEYTLGIAAVLKARKEFPDAQHIVTGSDWNGYTMDAKQYGWDNNIGIFIIGEFLGALNCSNPIRYYKKDENGNPVYQYHSA